MIRFIDEFVTAIVGGGIAGTIVMWLRQRQTTAQRLLSLAMHVQELEEGWILEGAAYGDKLSELKEHEVAKFSPSEGQRWLRNVELRLVLDEATWNAPSRPFYAVINGRRTWIVRDKIITKEDGTPSLINAVGFSPGNWHQALVSSKGLEELISWVEQVASEFYKPLWKFRVATLHIKRDPRLEMLDVLLQGVATKDRREVLGERLTKRALSFLGFYKEHIFRYLHPSAH